jgi:hypothetical protein
VEETWFNDELHNSEQRTYHVYYFILEAFAPKLASMFNVLGMRPVVLKDTPIEAFQAFQTWLRHEGTFRKQKDSRINEMRARFPDWCDLHFESYLSATVSEYDPLSFTEDSVYTFRHGDIAINLFVFAETYNRPLLHHDATTGSVLPLYKHPRRRRL